MVSLRYAGDGAGVADHLGFAVQKYGYMARQFGVFGVFGADFNKCLADLRISILGEARQYPSSPGPEGGKITGRPGTPERKTGAAGS